MNVLDNMVVPDIQVPLPSSVSRQMSSDSGDKFLFVCSRDLEAEEMDLLSSYGKVLAYDDCMINIPLDQLVAQGSVSYVLFDVRKKSHRLALSKEAGNDNFHLVALINKWEQFDDFVDDANCENCLSSLPIKQAFKRDFDRLLLEKKIRKPSCLKNIGRTFLKALGGWAKE